MPKGATEVPAPQNPPAAVVPTGGSIYDSTAGPAVDASADGALSGPHFVKEQTFHGGYLRVPVQGARNEDASSFSLSAMSESYFVAETKLLWHVTASVNTYKDFNNYPTSSFFQPQKFTLQTSRFDGLGNLYDDPVGYQMGPGGYINTSQKAITRELWDDNNPNHTVSSTEIDGFTYANAVYDNANWVWNGYGPGGSPHTRMAKAWCMPEDRMSFMPAQGAESTSTREISDGPWLNTIPGPYQVNAEVSTISNLQQPVDGLGIRLAEHGGMPGPDGVARSQVLYLWAPHMGSSANGIDHTPTPGSPYFYEFHPPALRRYDWTLHDWS